MADQININRYNLGNDIIRQTERVGKTPAGQPQGTTSTVVQGPSFQEMLNKQLGTENEISFSKHAGLRVEQRNIDVSEASLTRLSDACDRASQKGIKDALVVMDDSAFIVNAKSKVVVTVVDKAELKSNVFTNIEGAVFA